MTKILVLEKPEEKLRRERERLFGELSVYGERLAFLQDTVDEIKEMIEYYDGAIEALERLREKEIEHDNNKDLGLLRALKECGYKYITRNSKGGLRAHRHLPLRIGDHWLSVEYFDIDLIKVVLVENKVVEISDLLATHENGGESGK